MSNLSCCSADHELWQYHILVSEHARVSSMRACRQATPLEHL